MSGRPRICWLCDTVLERGEACDCGSLPIIDERTSERLPVFLVDDDLAATGAIGEEAGI